MAKEIREEDEREEVDVWITPENAELLLEWTGKRVIERMWGYCYKYIRVQFFDIQFTQTDSPVYGIETSGHEQVLEALVGFPRLVNQIKKW